MLNRLLGIHSAACFGHRATLDRVSTHEPRRSCLVGVGYLDWSKAKDSLRRRYQKWLLKRSEANLIGKLRFQSFEWDCMAKLEDYVRSGNPLELHRTMSE